MFWLWIVLSFLYGACCGSMFVLFITEQFQEEWLNDLEIVVAIIFVILSPILIILAVIMPSLSIVKIWRRWIIWVKMKKPIMWVYKKPIMWAWNNTVMVIQKRIDHKEMDDKEDEWKIERLGIKSK